MKTVYQKGLAFLGLAAAAEQKVIDTETETEKVKTPRFYPADALIYAKMKKKRRNRKRNKAARKSRRINQIRLN